MTPRVRGCAHAPAPPGPGAPSAGGRPKNERSNGAHETGPARGQCASSSDQKTEAPRIRESSAGVRATTTQVTPRSQPRPHSLRPSRSHTSGSGVARKWAGGGCARRRCRAAASRPRARAGLERSGVEVGAGAEPAERAPSPRHGPEHVVLALPSGGH